MNQTFGKNGRRILGIEVVKNVIPQVARMELCGMRDNQNNPPLRLNKERHSPSVVMGGILRFKKHPVKLIQRTVKNSPQ
jgi:hypothetical protein